MNTALFITESWLAENAVLTASGEIRLPAGRHELLVTAPRHLPFKATVDIHGMEQRQLLTAKLVAAWAPVTVLTEPVGATVLVDGAVRGATPAKLELDAGTHRGRTDQRLRQLGGGADRAGTVERLPGLPVLGVVGLDPAFDHLKVGLGGRGVVGAGEERQGGEGEELGHERGLSCALTLRLGSGFRSGRRRHLPVRRRQLLQPVG